MLNKEQKVEPTSENGNSTNPPVIQIVCGSQEHDRLVAWYGRCIHCKGTKMK